MATVALLARVSLAMVFITAALGKFADQPGSRYGLSEFGMPEITLKPAAVLLPLAEVATTVALLIQQSARWGAIGALVLLAAFMAGIATAMARGKAPDCHCFGQISSSPAGPRTLLRNAFLAALGVVVVAYGPGNSIGAWISARSTVELALVITGIAAAVSTAFSTILWIDRRHLRHDLFIARAALAAFPAGLPIGTHAPSFSLPSVDGHTVTLESLLGRGKPVAIVFVSNSCPSCLVMLPDLARWQTTLADRITIALLATGTMRQNRAVAEQHGLLNMLVQNEAEVFNAYRATATPSVVMVMPDGTIGSDTRSSHGIVEAVIRRSLRSDATTSIHNAVGSDEPFDVRIWSGAATQ